MSSSSFDPLLISYTPHCYYATNHLAYITEFTTVWLYLAGLHSVFRLFTNPNATKRSWFHAMSPFLLKFLAYWIGWHIKSERPFPACLAWYHSQYALPIPELVWYETANWVELLHGVLFYEGDDNRIIIFRQVGYFRLFVFCAGMAIAPIFVHMAGLATGSQLILSFVFSLFSIPLYMCTEAVSKYLIGKFYSR